MKTGSNRVLVALGSIAAIALLFGAFTVVWLLPRGPETGSANVAKTGGTTSTTTTKSANAPASAPSSAPISEQAHIQVQGTGTISAKPDLVNLQVGVQIQKDKLEDAQSEAATKMDAAMQQLKAAGIDDKDISTAQFNVQPVMDYQQNAPPRVTGFQVTNILNVKIRDITKAGKLIDSLVASGANTVYGLSFGFSDPSALMRQAREQAMKDALDKADQLAKLGNVTLGAPILIQDGGSNTPVPVMQAAADMSAGGVAKSAPPTVVNPGQQEIRVDVSVMYAIK
jgi:uncharacterized protein YggE